ncbi:MAG: PQQ-binding-like beta-propeller repeat protein, partial [Paracoccaceae bacterium]
ISDLSQLIRLDARTGKTIWIKELKGYLTLDRRRSKEVVVHHGPILAGGLLYVASSDGGLTAFDPVSGDVVQTLDIPGGATTIPVVADETLYVVSKTGKLHAFR